MTAVGKERRRAREWKRANGVSRTQLRQMLGITERQLRAWERQGWVGEGKSRARGRGASPVATQEPRYTFEELARLRMLVQLRRSGVSAARLRALHAAITFGLLKTQRGRWGDLQVRPEGKRVSVRYRGARMEPMSGQFLLDFSPRAKLSAVHSLEPRRKHQPTEAERRALADRFFLAGLRYEERPELLPKAVRAYEKAIEMNPRALGAYINLGTILYHQGRLDDAERYYHAALVLSPQSALVHFNLGNLVEERGQWELAREHYEEAIRLDPVYPDPRFNLALVYEKLGRHGRALQQWRGYLKLDATSRWAAYARQKLAQAPLRLVSRPKSSS